jgi:peptidoglycan/LPS O-acetylase OafA/YrhL
MPVVGVAPFTAVTAIDLIPSLLFTDPALIERLTGLQTRYVSGVYWSLFEEIKFYAVAGGLFFLCGRRLLGPLALISLAMIMMQAGALYLDNERVDYALRVLTFPQYAPFFLLGVALQQLFHNDNARQNRAAAFVAGIAALWALLSYSPLFDVNRNWVEPSMIAAFIGLFVVFLRRPQALACLQRSPLPRIGAASYTLYLIHESVGVSLAARGYQWLPVPYLWQLLVTLGLCFFSVLVFHHVERPVQAVLRHGRNSHA